MYAKSGASCTAQVLQRSLQGETTIDTAACHSQAAQAGADQCHIFDAETGQTQALQPWKVQNV